MSTLDLAFPGSLTATALDLDASITRDQYEELGALLGSIHEAVRFAIGDYLRKGTEMFGDDAYQLSEALRISHESKLQYVRVSEAIEPERRRAELTWSHHRLVAALSVEAQDDWLSRAVEHDWSNADLYAHINSDRELAWKPDLNTLVAAASDVYRESSVATCATAEQFHVSAQLMTNLGSALGILEQ